MTPEERKKYVDLISRVFVRALRDPHGDNEYELSEEQATSLLRERERAAILSFLDGEDVVEAMAQAMFDYEYPSADGARASLGGHYYTLANAALAALRALAQEEK